MPFKSQAQRRKFAQLLVDKKISPETFEEWSRETGSARLPEHVTPKRKARKTTAKKRSATKTAKRGRKTAKKTARKSAKKR